VNWSSAVCDEQAGERLDHVDDNRPHSAAGVNPLMGRALIVAALEPERADLT